MYFTHMDFDYTFLFCYLVSGYLTEKMFRHIVYCKKKIKAFIGKKKLLQNYDVRRADKKKHFWTQVRKVCMIVWTSNSHYK